MTISKSPCDLLEEGKIDIYQFNRMLRYRKGPCPKDCPDRKVGCKNPATCEKWAAHEAESQRIYELRKTHNRMNRARLKHISHVIGGRDPLTFNDHYFT